MKITGIVAEYNPFHNGHAYQIKKAREVTGCDYCIAVISGDFVQRGEVAVFSKYLRTKMALLCGADLVLEIPSIFAVSSAEDFAAGAVALLDQLGVVTHLCFGSEMGESERFMETAAILADEPDSFSAKLKEGLSEGLSWPQARVRALEAEGISDLGNFLETPNNLLGGCRILQSPDPAEKSHPADYYFTKGKRIPQPGSYRRTCLRFRYPQRNL